MKKNICAIALFIALILLITSCSYDEITSGGDKPINGTIKYESDDLNWVYKNSRFQIGVKLDSVKWIVLSDEDVKSKNIEALKVLYPDESLESLNELIDSAFDELDQVYDFVATSREDNTEIYITIMKNTEWATLIDFIEEEKQALIEAYEDLGLEVSSQKTSKVNWCGNTWATLSLNLKDDSGTLPIEKRYLQIDDRIMAVGVSGNQAISTRTVSQGSKYSSKYPSSYSVSEKESIFSSFKKNSLIW